MSNSLRQIVIAESIYLKIKQYCINKKITLTTFYYEMLQWFLKNYGHDTNLVFQASLNRGKKLSLWIQSRQLLDIKRIASNANVSDARVIYSALMLYVSNGVLLG